MYAQLTEKHTDTKKDIKTYRASTQTSKYNPTKDRDKETRMMYKVNYKIAIKNVAFRD